MQSSRSFEQTFIPEDLPEGDIFVFFFDWLNLRTQLQTLFLLYVIGAEFVHILNYWNNVLFFKTAIWSISRTI